MNDIAKIHVLLKASRLSLIALLSLLFLTPTNSQTLQRFEFSEVHMGTLFRIVTYAESQSMAQAASQQAFDRIENLNNVFSDYVATSELNLISNQADEKEVKVSKDLWTLLKLSDDLYHQSNGAFNVAMGPLTKLWRRGIRRQEVPSKDKIIEALDKSNWRDVVLDAKEKSIRLDNKDMRLDMGGIAKGYAVDQAYQVLLSEGLAISLVDGGGDIYAGEAPPGQDGWSIVIESNSNREVEEIILKNAALASSGSSFKYVEQKNKRYSHIISPITGYGISNPQTVNVKARSCVIADALATTLSIQTDPQIVKRITSYYKASLL